MIRLLLCLLFASSLIAADHPNVLLIITDDQGWGDFSCNGNTVLQTPVIDKLGAESVRFDRFFVSPLCAPTRSSMLTGRYSLRTGVRGVAAGEEAMRSEEVTLAEVLKAAGYRTGLFGKWHQGENWPACPNAQGFDEFWGYCRGHWNNYFDAEVRHNGKVEHSKGYIVDDETAHTIKFIDDAKDKPWLAWVAYTTPHSPFQVPDEYFNRYKGKGIDDELACIYGMCANLDDNVGRLLKHLDDIGQRDNTIVLFLTDNGPNTQRFNGDMKGKKGSLDEGGSRVPLFVRYPARIKESRLVKPIAMHIDVLPTLVELCGVPMLKGLPLDGRSLVPLLEGREKGWPERTLFTQHMLAGAKGKSGAAVRTQQYRAIIQGKTTELYDMLADPGQKKDIASEKPDVTKLLGEGYAKWWKEVKTDADKPRDVPEIGHAEENPIELTTPNARINEGLTYGGLAPNNSWVHNWVNLDATVKWDVNVVSGGSYQLKLQYLCPKGNGGSVIDVSAGEATKSATVAETDYVQIPSPDRVQRKEAYEMVWSYLDVGSFTLSPGKTSIQVKAKTRAGAEVMELKAVWLEKR
jgi:arylsulfatase A